MRRDGEQPRRSPPLQSAHEQASRRLSATLLGAAVVSAVGVGVSTWTAQIHANIERLGNAYTSFCNVNESVNCDVVLASSFGKIQGVPVAWFALATYLLVTALFFFAWRRPGTRGRLALQLASAAVIASLVFSAYLMGVSAIVLGTLCPMCMTLYAVVSVLAVLTFFAHRLSLAAHPGLGSVLPLRQVLGVAVAAGAATTVVAAASWPEARAFAPDGFDSLTEIREYAPEFYDWYVALPVVSEDRLTTDANRNDKVRIVEFSDFQCGHCRRNHTLISELTAKRGDRIEIHHRNFPLDTTCNEAVSRRMHPFACRAAEAAECAGRQGRRNDMAGKLFENQSQLFEANLFRLAEKIGIEMEDFRHCMESQTELPGIIADARVGQALELSSTPTLFINGRRILGTLDDVASYELAIMIEARLASGETLSGG